MYLPRRSSTYDSSTIWNSPPSRRHSSISEFDHSVNVSDYNDFANEYFTNDVYQRVQVKNVDVPPNVNSLNLPNFPMNSAINNYNFVLVAFKANRLDVFYIPSNSATLYKENDLVIVEADRGHDLGKIIMLNLSILQIRLLKYQQFKEQQFALSELSSSAPNSANDQQVIHVPKPIIRLALLQEIVGLNFKKVDELNAKKLCLMKLSNYNLYNMKIIDCEYQFDRKKLTFYYKTDKRIDFRDLVRELFRIYKTRIWMCAVVSNVEVSDEDELDLLNTYTSSANTNYHHNVPPISAPTGNKFLGNSPLELNDNLFESTFDKYQLNFGGAPLASAGSVGSLNNDLLHSNWNSSASTNNSINLSNHLQTTFQAAAPTSSTTNYIPRQFPVMTHETSNNNEEDMNDTSLLGSLVDSIDD